MKKDLNSREKRFKLIGAVGMGLFGLAAGVLQPVLEKSDSRLLLVVTFLLVGGFLAFLVTMIVKGVQLDNAKSAARAVAQRQALVRGGAQPPQVRPGGAAYGGGGADPWKEQLDGFLAAGVIDRAEYKALLERRRR